MNRELRTFKATLEVRAKGTESTIGGHAAVFNQLSADLGGFRERILPGAFADSIERGDDVRALWQHDPKFVLGRTKNDTLTLSEDDDGLAYEADPPAASFARDAIAQIRGGYVDQSSFGFAVPPGGDRWLIEQNQNVREVMTATLYDVSPVTFPAYEGTDVDVRGIEAAGLSADLLAALVRRERKLTTLPDDDRLLADLRHRLDRIVAGEGPPKAIAAATPSLAMLRNRVTVLGHRLRG